MKRIIYIILLMTLTVPLSGQSHIRLTNYWDNTFYINPGAIDEQFLSVFSVAARKQWVNFPGSPRTFFATGTLYNSDLHTQFGLRAVRDVLGYTSTTDVDLTYSYSLNLNKSWNLHMGIAASYQNLSYDISKVTFETPDDQSIYERLKQESNFNADLGFEFTSKEWKIGAAGQNVFSLFSSVNKLFTNTNYIYGLYKPVSKQFISLGYGACAFQYAKTVQMEFNISAFFRKTDAPNTFQAGFIYRTWSEMGFILGLELSKNFKLSYSYDYNVGGISRSSYGTNELILTYRLNKVWRCRNCWF